MQCVAVSGRDQTEREASDLQEAKHSEPPLNGQPLLSFRLTYEPKTIEYYSIPI